MSWLLCLGKRFLSFGKVWEIYGCIEVKIVHTPENQIEIL